MNADSRFSLDSSLGRLARFLRMLGIDAAWLPGDDLTAALGRARIENRILLTRAASLPRLGITWPRAGGQRILSEDVAEQLSEVGRCWPIFERAKPFTRCPVCNVVLAELDSAEARPLVPEHVARTQSAFRRCEGCARVYWSGTHTERVTEIFRIAAEKISKAPPSGKSEGAVPREESAPSDG